jgi:retinol-binding protein 3
MLLRLLCAVLVTNSIQSLRQFYVSPEVAARMSGDLHRRLARGEFQSITDGEELARQLTADLQEISHDQHLRVQFFATGAPPTRTSLTPSPEDLESERQDGLRDNFGFARVRRLPGNVGYLDIRAFHTLSIAKPAVVAAMRVVANTDALIIDLRGNFGGEPDCVTFVASHLFDKPAHLDTLVMRWPENHTQEYWTAPVAPRFGGHKPVYLLTSHQTFSGGEAFAYNLQALRRVRIVGEPTAGAAHLTIPIRVSEHFAISVPFGRSINPTTGRDWEGTGVVPDVSAAASDAVAVAYRLALDNMINSTTDIARKNELREISVAQALRELAR